MKNDIFSAERPIYLQLYERLRDDIIAGVFPYESRYLSKRVIADRYGVSLVTTEHALELLLDEGYIESRERSGYYVTFRENDFFAPAKENVTAQVIKEKKEAADEHTGFPFSSYAKTMRRVLSDYGETLLERVPGTGLMRLREVLCEYLARSRGIRVTPDRIVIGAGSEYLYGQIVQFFGREKVYGLEDPSYSKIESVYALSGAAIEHLGLGGDGIKSSALQKSTADILHISPYRSFPSGISTSASKRREYLRWAAERNAFIIEDDFESEFSTSRKPEETVFALSREDNVLYLNSFTRTIAPSIRISYLILPEKLKDEFYGKMGFYSCTVSAFEQYVLAEFIASGEFERHLNRVRRSKRGQ